MNQIICFFMPSIISLAVYEKLNRYDLKVKSMIYHYVTFFYIINFICLMITSFVFNIDSFNYTEMATVKYLLLAGVLALIVPVIVSVLNKNLQVKLESKKHEKK